MSVANPTILGVAEEYGAGLFRGRRDPAQDLIREYAGARKLVQERVSNLARMIDAAELAGEEVTPSWLFQKNRLQSIEKAITEEIGRIAKIGQVTVADAQDAAVRDALEAAQRLTELSLQRSGTEASVAGAWNRPNLQAGLAAAGMSSGASPLAALFDELPGQAGAAIRSALITAVATGIPTKRLAAYVSNALGGNAARALTIARTEVMRSYRIAHARSFEANPKIVTGWTWHSRTDSSTCLGCWTMHGKEFPPGEVLESHPNCRCIPIPRTPSWEELGFSGIEDTRPEIRTGEDLFRNLSASRMRAILGPTRYALWSTGKIPFQALGSWRNAGPWGRNRIVTPIRELRALAGVTPGRLPKPPARVKPPRTAPPTAPTAPAAPVAAPAPAPAGYGAGPLGKVSDAFDDVMGKIRGNSLAMVNPGYKAVLSKMDEALATMNRTFRIPSIPKMPELYPITSQFGPSVMGAYSRSPFGANPLRLGFRAKAPMETVYHEVMHYIDHLALGVRGVFGSKLGMAQVKGTLGTNLGALDAKIAQLRAINPNMAVGSQAWTELQELTAQRALMAEAAAAMAPVMGAIVGSKGYTSLRSVLASGTTLRPGDVDLLAGTAGSMIPMSVGTQGTKWAAYATEAEELFARATAQWLVKKSGSAAAMREIEEAVYFANPTKSGFLLDSSGNRIVNPMADQWTWDDFRPIEEALDDLMRGLGWNV